MYVWLWPPEVLALKVKNWAEHFVPMCKRSFVSCRWIGFARIIYIRCVYGIVGREITKYTVIYGAYIRFWPTLQINLQFAWIKEFACGRELRNLHVGARTLCMQTCAQAVWNPSTSRSGARSTSYLKSIYINFWCTQHKLFETHLHQLLVHAAQAIWNPSTSISGARSTSYDNHPLVQTCVSCLLVCGH